MQKITFVSKKCCLGHFLLKILGVNSNRKTTLLIFVASICRVDQILSKWFQKNIVPTTISLFPGKKANKVQPCKEQGSYIFLWHLITLLSVFGVSFLSGFFLFIISSSFSATWYVWNDLPASPDLVSRDPSFSLLVCPIWV